MVVLEEAEGAEEERGPQQLPFVEVARCCYREGGWRSRQRDVG
jgi:hypothetical protein